MAKCQICKDECLDRICDVCNQKVSLAMASHLRKELEEIKKTKSGWVASRTHLGY